jgi:biotin carboxyl carrier protein
MPGLVVRVHVHEGERVARGQVLLVVEAMKMEHTLRAPKDGVVRRLAAEAGKLLEGGAALLEVEE